MKLEVEDLQKLVVFVQQLSAGQFPLDKLDEHTEGQVEKYVEDYIQRSDEEIYSHIMSCCCKTLLADRGIESILALFSMHAQLMIYIKKEHYARQKQANS